MLAKFQLRFERERLNCQRLEVVWIVSEGYGDYRGGNFA